MLEDAATAKEVQDLARHATPQLTMNVYGRVREESLAQTVEKVAGRVLSEEKYVPSMYRQAVGAEPENATAIDNKQLRLKSSGGAEGNRTPDRRTIHIKHLRYRTHTEPRKSPTRQHLTDFLH